MFDLQTGEGYFDDGSGGAERWMDTRIWSCRPTRRFLAATVGRTKVIIEKQQDIDIIDGPDPIDLNGATLYWREND